MLGPKVYRITYDISANISYPIMIRTHLEQGIASCATGYGRSIFKKSLGEALERHISFSNTSFIPLTQTLSEMAPLVKEWFIKNSRLKDDKGLAEKHQFAMVKVRELSSGYDYYAPVVAFRLNQHADDGIYGLRDSSGSALHQSQELAFLGSRDEFCERQALSLFWYFGHCNFILELNESDLFYKLRTKLTFIKSLSCIGKIYLFDISLFSPVRTILSVFLSDVGQVKFAAGASGSHNPYEAIEKSLLEMYQAYVLMMNITDERVSKLNHIDDELIVGYLSHNCDKTVNAFNDIIYNGNGVLGEIPECINFKRQFIKEPVFLFQEKIVFADKVIFHCVMKSIHGFKRMNLDDNDIILNMAAASHYGYRIQINKGPIPFA